MSFEVANSDYDHALSLNEPDSFVFPMRNEINW